MHEHQWQGQESDTGSSDESSGSDVSSSSDGESSESEEEDDAVDDEGRMHQYRKGPCLLSWAKHWQSLFL